MIEALEKANAVLRAGTTSLIGKAAQRRLKLKLELWREQKKRDLQTKTAAQLTGTIYSLNTNVDSLSSEVDVKRKGGDDAAFMSDGAMAQEAWLASQNRKLAQQLADVHKTVTIIRK